MTNVIELAKQAGASRYTNRHYPDRPTHTFTVEKLELYTKLVRNAALEEAAQKCECVGPQGSALSVINSAFAHEIRNLKDKT